MILGMTGFGAVQVAAQKVKTVIEARSVNHRFLDVSYHLPAGFGSIEEKIYQIVQKHIERGKVTISIKIIEKPHQTIVLNKDVAKKHIQYAHALHREFKLKDDLTLSHIIQLPGVLEAKETFITAEQLWPALQRGLNQCLKSVVNMRKREGRTLAADIRGNLKFMSSEVSRIRSRTAAILREKKKNLTDDEFKSFQKSADIHEEISRLGHFIEELNQLSRQADGVSIGKKVDFIAQEMQRETNTMGSKLLDKVVTGSVIVLKSKVEKIREQAQNIE